jgi:hypothetical protein
MPSESKANRTCGAKHASCPAACVCRRTTNPSAACASGRGVVCSPMSLVVERHRVFRSDAALRRNVLHGLLCVSCRCMW